MQQANTVFKQNGQDIDKTGEVSQPETHDQPEGNLGNKVQLFDPSATGMQHQLSAAIIRDTVNVLPVHPRAISNISGPVVDLKRVDSASVDVTVQHSFRAHYDREEVLAAAHQWQQLGNIKGSDAAHKHSTAEHPFLHSSYVYPPSPFPKATITEHDDGEDISMLPAYRPAPDIQHIGEGAAGPSGLPSCTPKQCCEESLHTDKELVDDSSTAQGHLLVESRGLLDVHPADLQTCSDIPAAASTVASHDSFVFKAPQLQPSIRLAERGSPPRGQDETAQPLSACEPIVDEADTDDDECRDVGATARTYRQLHLSPFAAAAQQTESAASPVAQRALLQKQQHGLVVAPYHMPTMQASGTDRAVIAVGHQANLQQQWVQQQQHPATAMPAAQMTLVNGLQHLVRVPSQVLKAGLQEAGLLPPLQAEGRLLLRADASMQSNNAVPLPGDAAVGETMSGHAAVALATTTAECDVDTKIRVVPAPADSKAAAGENHQQQGQQLVPASTTGLKRPVRAAGDWELDPHKVVMGKRIAVGGFAEVFVGKYEGTVVAIKRLFASDAPTITSFIQEISLLTRLRHPNLILFMGYVARPELCIITEFMARGSLFHILRQHAGQPAEPRLQRAVASAVARGMAYLHSRSPPILHLDLKSPNILVDERWRIKVTDFGLSTVRQQTYVSSGHAGGTPEWMAPEVLRCERYGEPADVFSYGVVLWELLTGQVPWEGLNPMQVVGAVGFACRSLPPPTQGDPFLISLCEKCMLQHPAERPTFAQIVEGLDRHFGPAQQAFWDTAQPILPPLKALPPPQHEGEKQPRVSDTRPILALPPANHEPAAAMHGSQRTPQHSDLEQHIPMFHPPGSPSPFAVAASEKFSLPSPALPPSATGAAAVSKPELQLPAEPPAVSTVPDNLVSSTVQAPPALHTADGQVSKQVLIHTHAVLHAAGESLPLHATTLSTAAPSVPVSPNLQLLDTAVTPPSPAQTQPLLQVPDSPRRRRSRSPCSEIQSPPSVATKLEGGGRGRSLRHGPLHSSLAVSSMLDMQKGYRSVAGNSSWLANSSGHSPSHLPAQQPDSHGFGVAGVTLSPTETSDVVMFDQPSQPAATTAQAQRLALVAGREGLHATDTKQHSGPWSPFSAAAKAPVPHSLSRSSAPASLAADSRVPASMAWNSTAAVSHDSHTANSASAGVDTGGFVQSETVLADSVPMDVGLKQSKVEVTQAATEPQHLPERGQPGNLMATQSTPDAGKHVTTASASNYRWPPSFLFPQSPLAASSTGRYVPYDTSHPSRPQHRRTGSAPLPSSWTHDSQGAVDPALTYQVLSQPASSELAAVLDVRHTASVAQPTTLQHKSQHITQPQLMPSIRVLPVSGNPAFHTCVNQLDETMVQPVLPANLLANSTNPGLIPIPDPGSASPDSPSAPHSGDSITFQVPPVSSPPSTPRLSYIQSFDANSTGGLAAVFCSAEPPSGNDAAHLPLHPSHAALCLQNTPDGVAALQAAGSRISAQATKEVSTFQVLSLAPADNGHTPSAWTSTESSTKASVAAGVNGQTAVYQAGRFKVTSTLPSNATVHALNNGSHSLLVASDGINTARQSWQGGFTAHQPDATVQTDQTHLVQDRPPSPPSSTSQPAFAVQSATLVPPSATHNQQLALRTASPAHAAYEPFAVNDALLGANRHVDDQTNSRPISSPSVVGPQFSSSTLLPPLHTLPAHVATTVVNGTPSVAKPVLQGGAVSHYRKGRFTVSSTVPAAAAASNHLRPYDSDPLHSVPSLQPHQLQHSFLRTSLNTEPPTQRSGTSCVELRQEPPQAGLGTGSNLSVRASKSMPQLSQETQAASEATAVVHPTLPTCLSQPLSRETSNMHPPLHQAHGAGIESPSVLTVPEKRGSHRHLHVHFNLPDDDSSSHPRHSSSGASTPRSGSATPTRPASDMGAEERHYHRGRFTVHEELLPHVQAADGIEEGMLAVLSGPAVVPATTTGAQHDAADILVKAGLKVAVESSIITQPPPPSFLVQGQSLQGIQQPHTATQVLDAAPATTDATTQPDTATALQPAVRTRLPQHPTFLLAPSPAAEVMEDAGQPVPLPVRRGRFTVTEHSSRPSSARSSVAGYDSGAHSCLQSPPDSPLLLSGNTAQLANELQEALLSATASVAQPQIGDAATVSPASGLADGVLPVGVSSTPQRQMTDCKNMSVSSRGHFCVIEESDKSNQNPHSSCGLTPAEFPSRLDSHSPQHNLSGVLRPLPAEPATVAAALLHAAPAEPCQSIAQPGWADSSLQDAGDAFFADAMQLVTERMTSNAAYEAGASQASRPAGVPAQLGSQPQTDAAAQTDALDAQAPEHACQLQPQRTASPDEYEVTVDHTSGRLSVEIRLPSRTCTSHGLDDLDADLTSSTEENDDSVLEGEDESIMEQEDREVEELMVNINFDLNAGLQPGENGGLQEDGIQHDHGMDRDESVQEPGTPRYVHATAWQLSDVQLGEGVEDESSDAAMVSVSDDMHTDDDQ